MSHFTVMVIGDAELEKALAPFEECPDDMKNSPFCTFINKSKDPEEIEKYKNGTTSLIEFDGKVYSRYDEIFEQFKRKENPDDFFSQSYLALPDTCKQFEGSYKLIYPTFEEFLSDYCGYGFDEKNDAYGYYSNPNAKWDWWEIGGRWTGFFKGKKDVLGSTGNPGLMTPKAKAEYYDVIRLKDIDFEAMEKEAEVEANATYDTIDAILKGRIYPSWVEIRERHGEGNIDAARDEYHAHPVVKDFNEARFHIWGDFHETYCNSREEYVSKKKASIITPYAFLKDGKWVEKGQMGWFGMSSNEKESEDWNKEFYDMIRSLPEDTLLTLIDCHI